MPAALERALKSKARSLGLGKERTGAYVYGTLRKTGWQPQREQKAGGGLVTASPAERAIDAALACGGAVKPKPKPKPRRYAGGGAVSSAAPPDTAALEREFGLPAGLLRAVTRVESAGDPNAVSPKGAVGLTQLMPGTARDLGVTDRRDPGQSLRGGAQYLRQLLDRYGGSLPHALAAYNWGPGNLDRQGFGQLPDETSKYLQAVTAALGMAPPTVPPTSYGETIDPALASDAALPQDLPSVVAMQGVARAAGMGGGAGARATGGRGAQQMPGGPDADAFTRFMGEMLGNPTKAMNEAVAPQKFAGGGRVAAIDQALKRGGKC